MEKRILDFEFVSWRLVKPWGLILAFFIFGCDGQERKGEAEKIKENFNLEFISGKEIQIEVIPKSASLNDLVISTKGFEFNLNDTLKDKDPIEDAFVADLDGNGFQEFYLTTRSAGSGSYASIIAYGSNRDKSLTPIYFYPTRDKDLEMGQALHGFRGHDRFFIDSEEDPRILFREFPVFREGDSNANPSSKKRTAFYELVAGEAGWILRLKE